MLRKLLVIAALGLFALPTIAKAEFQEGDYELTLSGSGFNGPDFDGTSFGFGGSLGYFLTKDLEISIRETFDYTDLGGVDGSAHSVSSRIALDYHFDMGRWRPFIGVNGGYICGDFATDGFSYAPEAGVKWFANSTTFIFVMVEYQFFCEDDDDFLDDGEFLYSMGIGFRF
jgi:hypothetical protein